MVNTTVESQPVMHNEFIKLTAPAVLWPIVVPMIFLSYSNNILGTIEACHKYFLSVL